MKIIAAETESGPGDEHLKLKDSPSSADEKSQWYTNDVRGIELVDSRCYRTPNGFQKEATFPYESLFDPAQSNRGGSEALSEDRVQNSQQSTFARRRGPLERFTLMIGENILHFKIVKGPENNDSKFQSLLNFHGFKVTTFRGILLMI
ncbi:unnamed protein product [Cylicostephanus goldi]|uniref:Uncharacterized protein n=1 Tax=Cylicostephanus goldi TaxID=71465 RepID=A0A3P6SJP9_CYLGO|nr:unnamed protein product [Cylicostephanus goldi]